MDMNQIASDIFAQQKKTKLRKADIAREAAKARRATGRPRKILSGLGEYKQQVKELTRRLTDARRELITSKNELKLTLMKLERLGENMNKPTKLIILRCNSCEETDEYSPKETEQPCNFCKSSEDGFTELIACENCGEEVEENQLIGGDSPDNSDTCEKCVPPSREQIAEDRADYDYQCAKDARAERRGEK